MQSCCCCSAPQSWPMFCDPMECSMTGFSVHHHLPEFAQTHVHWVSDAIQPSHPLSLWCLFLLLPSIFPSIRAFSNESAFPIRWPKYWSFSFSVSPSNECSGLISFRIDWFDLLAVQGTLKSLLQHHCSKASVLQCSAFFMVQLSYPYMTTGKTIFLTKMGLCWQSVIIEFYTLSAHVPIVLVVSSYENNYYFQIMILLSL